MSNMSNKPSFREMTARDEEILGFPEGYDSVQVTLSRFVWENEQQHRETLKTAFIPVEALKDFIERQRND